MAWHAYGDEAKQRLSSFVPQFSYGAEVKQKLSHLVPQLFSNAPEMRSANAAEPKDTTSPIAASEPVADPAPAQESSDAASATPAPAAPAPVTSAAETPPTQIALPPELTQSIETMAREIASLKQTLEQLQAGQQQLSRDVAKVSEHGTRHKLADQTSKPAYGRDRGVRQQRLRARLPCTLFPATNPFARADLPASHRATRSLYPATRADATSATVRRQKRPPAANAAAVIADEVNISPARFFGPRRDKHALLDRFHQFAP